VVTGAAGPAGPFPAPAPGPDRINRLALASLVCGLAGIPLFGVVTGLVAIFLAALALSSIRGTSQRGLGLALGGLFLGLVDVVGWVIFLALALGGSSTGTDLRLGEHPPPLKVIQELEPALQRSMRANVVIESPGGLAALGGKAIGSGVILQIQEGDALIVTNRHVVDHHFASDVDENSSDLARLGPLTIKMLGPSESQGRVVWLAPGKIDLALVRAPISSAAQASNWQKGRPVRVGQSVFAIGNPYHLGWSHTQGVVSQLRTQLAGLRQVQVIQTQASINPGNSGGGLYDTDGYLLGINTWTSDKRISEGIGFAIALETLLDLAPPPIKVTTSATPK
jgi:S1-C subfamily serine protease